MLWTATYAVGVLLSGSETGKPHEVHNVVPLCARAVAGGVPMRNAFRDDRSRHVVVGGSAGSGSWSPPSFRRMMRQRLLEGDERYYEHVRCSELQIDLFRNRVGCTAADGLVGAADAPRLVVQGVLRFPRQCTCLRAFGFGFMHEGVNKSGVGNRKKIGLEGSVQRIPTSFLSSFLHLHADPAAIAAAGDVHMSSQGEPAVDHGTHVQFAL